MTDKQKRKNKRKEKSRPGNLFLIGVIVGGIGIAVSSVIIITIILTTVHETHQFDLTATAIEGKYRVQSTEIRAMIQTATAEASER